MLSLNAKVLSSSVAATAFAVTQAAGAAGVPPDVSNVHSGKQLENSTSLNEALSGGKHNLTLRLRYENVSDDLSPSSPLAGTGDADQTHLRTVLGYSTARYHGFYGRVEFEAGKILGNDNALNLDSDLTFPPGPAGSRVAAGHSIIPDNDFEEINEAYLGFRHPAVGDTTVKVGRQEIIYNDHRWVGNIVWRQNFQTYDAIRVDNSSVPGLSVSYSYIDRVNRTFGEDSPFAKWEMNSHLINAAYETPFGTLTGYGYLLDFQDNPNTPFPEGAGATGTPGVSNFDSDTLGLRFVGKAKVSDAVSAVYELEWANQDPTEDANSAFDDNDYYLIEGGAVFKIAGKPVDVRLTHEVLEGNGTNSLQTPLATFHAFNGWTDKFIGPAGGTATPLGGLEDTHLTAVVKGLVGKSKLVLRYHDFQANTTVSGVDDYGSEFAALFAKPFAKNWLALVKYADFQDGGDGFSYDTRKYWAMVAYQFK